MKEYFTVKGVVLDMVLPAAGLFLFYEIACVLSRVFLG